MTDWLIYACINKPNPMPIQSQERNARGENWEFRPVRFLSLVNHTHTTPHHPPQLTHPLTQPDPYWCYSTHFPRRVPTDKGAPPVCGCSLPHKQVSISPSVSSSQREWRRKEEQCFFLMWNVYFLQLVQGVLVIITIIAFLTSFVSNEYRTDEWLGIDWQKI